MKASAKSCKPLLFVDVDGVISTYGFAAAAGVPGADHGPVGTYHQVEGILHHIGSGMAKRLSQVAPHFEMVWATGWGERANEHLVYILEMPGTLEVVEFEVAPSTDGSGHWKLDALTSRAGDQPAAWIDDGHNEACESWAAGRAAPTLLVSTDPAIGMTDEHVHQLLAWAAELERANQP
ncbi:MAG TPA: HAD domain-containing protein [Solirubrobacterales bacterium]|jgi:hypothetical protein|nr:HAD domain-containing protein [Solirubrobacterales bacterium]